MSSKSYESVGGKLEHRTVHLGQNAKKRGDGMSKKVRNLKIEEIGDFAGRNTMPRIRLSGHWLKRAGFKAGHRVEIHLANEGEMTLRFVEPKTEKQNHAF
ncbi:MAG TPA: SymE family type I addiction module toxin [Verrucomicrobiae bacterium]|nr:SymE family type I addiction module toxin [Verrucomicrobiae bacterium]